MLTRLIAVRFLAATANKGSRLKAMEAGHTPRVYGYHSFNTGAMCASEAAARDYFAACHPDAYNVTVTPVSNPTAQTFGGGKESFYVVTYDGLR